MRLNGMKDNPGSRKERVRIGRGIGSGMGKMGGRGGKGQTARTGVRLGGFEGGQMPLFRRLPKRGFNTMDRRRFNEMNVGALQKAIDEGRLDATKPVDNAALVAAGLVRRAHDGLRLLGDGELKAKLSITVDHATASAKAAVEKAGGSVTVIERKVLPADEAKRAKSAAKKAKQVKKGGGAAED
ncbi:MAG TPA: 50S ribosomal protein L15 [Hyphomicrobiaceae bacterium]|nr:50S ribosomal protein L15 [Hyphomicrobiaceae bacterium]